MYLKIVIIVSAFSVTGCNLQQYRTSNSGSAELTATQQKKLPVDNNATQSGIFENDKPESGVQVASSSLTSLQRKDDQSTDNQNNPASELIDALPDSLPIALPIALIEKQDIWVRLRSGMKLPDYNHKRVGKELQWFSKHQKYMDRVADRAEPFMFMILEEIEKRNIPTEIALLPIVESAFQPFAYSHGRAAGIWQFIPGTGRMYGLKQNWWYDGRRDVKASTHAALDYLQDLHRNFKGDWLLALAAYNSGEGTVKKAIRYNRKKGRPTDFWHLKLPRETQGYVPKLLAISALIAEPKRNGIVLKSIEDKQQIFSVNIGSQIDLALAADMADMSLEEVYQLNPGFNRWATDPDGPHHLLIPVAKKQSFEDKLAKLPKNKRVSWKRHKIKSGEVIGTIARKYRTTVSVLRKVNRLRGNNIRAGKHLIIPVATKSLNSYSLSSTQRQKAILSKKRSGKKIIHRVKKGDSFWTISRKYKVSMYKLAKWNGMAPRDRIKPGQKLAVWKTAGNKKVAAISPINTSHPAATIRPIHYTVRNGDSLSRISHRFKVTIAQLRKWNRLPKGKYLQPGQRLKLFVDVTRQT